MLRCSNRAKAKTMSGHSVAVRSGASPASTAKIEIERKFLVRDDGWRSSVIATMALRDGLLAQEAGSKVRVRTDGTTASITVKGPRVGLARPEFEYPIPLADAESMLAMLCIDMIIAKTRHLVPHGGHIWDVDVYEGALAGIVYAEVELRREDEPLSLPSWIGAEVTGDPAYSKRALLARLSRPQD